MQELRCGSKEKTLSNVVLDSLSLKKHVQGAKAEIEK